MFWCKLHREYGAYYHHVASCRTMLHDSYFVQHVAATCNRVRVIRAAIFTVQLVTQYRCKMLPVLPQWNIIQTCLTIDETLFTVVAASAQHAAPWREEKTTSHHSYSNLRVRQTSVAEARRAINTLPFPQPFDSDSPNYIRRQCTSDKVRIDHSISLLSLYLLAFW